jgi:hypothetical protein
VDAAGDDAGGESIFAVSGIVALAGATPKARLAGCAEPLFEIKLRLSATGRWSLGVVGSTLGLY